MAFLFAKISKKNRLQLSKIATVITNKTYFVTNYRRGAKDMAGILFIT